mmetsp:Transcript_85458/g.178548  ORF Transcript_85458/g.178548 Transcript_85458/m.178548 type:complete len:237 (-) Transcript_85458:2031-2741(-)
MQVLSERAVAFAETLLLNLQQLVASISVASDANVWHLVRLEDVAETFQHFSGVLCARQVHHHDSAGLLVCELKIHHDEQGASRGGGVVGSGADVGQHAETFEGLRVFSGLFDELEAPLDALVHIAGDGASVLEKLLLHESKVCLVGILLACEGLPTRTFLVSANKIGFSRHGVEGPESGAGRRRDTSVFQFNPAVDLDHRDVSFADHSTFLSEEVRQDSVDLRRRVTDESCCFACA